MPAADESDGEHEMPPHEQARLTDGPKRDETAVQPSAAARPEWGPESAQDPRHLKPNPSPGILLGVSALPSPAQPHVSHHHQPPHPSHQHPLHLHPGHSGHYPPFPPPPGLYHGYPHPAMVPPPRQGCSHEVQIAARAHPQAFLVPHALGPHGIPPIPVPHAIPASAGRGDGGDVEMRRHPARSAPLLHPYPHAPSAGPGPGGVHPYAAYYSPAFRVSHHYRRTTGAPDQPLHRDEQAQTGGTTKPRGPPGAASSRDKVEKDAAEERAMELDKREGESPGTSNDTAEGTLHDSGGSTERPLKTIRADVDRRPRAVSHVPLYRIAFVNHRYVNVDEASVPITDFGFAYGCSIVEELLVTNGNIVRLDEHLNLFMASARSIGIPVPLSIGELRVICEYIVKANREGPRSALFMQLSFGAYAVRTRILPGSNVSTPSLVIHSQPLLLVDPSKIQSLSLLPLPDSRPIASEPVEPSALYVSSSQLPSILALHRARLKGFDEALLFDASSGFITGTTQGNVFCVKFGVIYTPPATGNVIDGVMRRYILRLCRHHEVDVREVTITRPYLCSAAEVFCVSTLDEVQPVRGVGDRPIEDAVPGPVTLRIMKWIRAEDEPRLDSLRRKESKLERAQNAKGESRSA